MTFAICLAQLQEQGVIDATRAERYSAEYERLRKAHAKVLGEAGAVAAASRDAMDAIAFKAANDRRQKLLQLSTQKSILDGLTEYQKNGGQVGRYAIALLDHHEAVPGVSNVDNRRAALAQIAWSRMDGFMDRFSRDLGGKVSRLFGGGVDMDDVVRALKGEQVGNTAAKGIADAVADTFEWLRQMFNEAGGSIAKLDGWGLPQSHDAISIARAGVDAWKAKIVPRLDVSRMIDHETGLSFTADRLDEVLNDVWDTITSDGLDKVTPGTPGGSGKMANRRADHRFLHFKSADDWLAYNAEFGVGGPFEAIVRHIDGMTREIAAMQVLGPNPALTVRWVGDMLRQGALPTAESGISIKLQKAAVSKAGEMERMWRYYTGALTAPDPSRRGFSRFMGGLRNLNVASKLGSAFIAAFTSDPIFMTWTAKMQGLSAARILANYVRLMNPADPAMRAAARHAGLVFSEATQAAERVWHEGQGLNGVGVHELTRRASSAVMDASLLAPHTEMAKSAFSLGFMMDFAEHAHKGWDALDSIDRARFTQYGIDAAAWDLIRSTPVADAGGVKLIRVGDVASRTDVDGKAAFDAALRIGEMIDSETRFAVPGELLRAQAAVATIGGGLEGKRGTVAGELVHSATQFKTYAVIAMMTHLQRALFSQRSGWSRLTYGLTLPAALTFGGVAANQFLAIASGEDPPPIDNGSTWAAGFARGGGAGMLGDFAQAGLTGRSRSGQSIMSWAAGPTIGGVGQSAFDLTLGNAKDAMGDLEAGRPVDVGFAGEAYAQARGMIPGQNIWYSRLATNRLMLDQLQSVLDPNYRMSWMRMERAAAKRNQPYYWAPGETAPDRAPDLANIAPGETLQ